MRMVYYIEINLLCIIFLLLFTRQRRYQSGRLSADSRIFGLMLWSTVILCASDMVAGLCRGQLFPGARVLVELSNLIFFEALSAVSFLWMAYVFTKLKLIEQKKEILLWAVPFLAISIVTIINPFTHWMFSIDENNLYSRGMGVYVHWGVLWSYFLITTVIIAYKIIQEKDKRKRKEIIPFLSFIVAPGIAAVIQMLFYGVSCSQVGITVSLVFISLTEQNNQILTDALTGLNNRYGFYKHLENYLQRHPETNLSLMMIDINNFKQVNDQFGHLEGDRALADVADALKQSCEEADFRLFACRYGGDEFIIAGCDCRQDEILNLKAKIHQKLAEKNDARRYPYVLSVSIGTASGICLKSADMESLLRIADEEMYAEKSNRRTGGPGCSLVTSSQK